MKAESERKDTRSIVRNILELFPLCDWCLGRQFPEWMANKDSKRRGTLLRRNLRGMYLQGSKKQCYICKGIMSSIDRISEQVLNALGGYEFETFLVGASLPSEMLDIEDQVRARLQLKGGESLKSEITQSVGRFISSKIGKMVKYRRPDLTVITNPIRGTVTINTKSVYLLGRYIKMTRGLPQKQPRKEMSLDSRLTVEKILADKLLSHFQARQIRFTWLGGEDSNSLVLGDGRPFYAEIIDPKLRGLQSSKLTLQRQKMGVSIKDVQLMESKPLTRPDFTVLVLARVRFNEKVERLKLDKLEKDFTNVMIESLSKRKAKVLLKRVYSLSVKHFRREKGELMIECDGGLSIKKLVTGGNGGVHPNFSQALGIPVSLDEDKPFDILDVKLKQGIPTL